MKKTKREEQRRAKHMLQERKRLEKKRETDELLEADLSDSDVLDDLAVELGDANATEEIEKEYDDTAMEAMAKPMMGATTFEELDALRETREKAEAVRELGWDVQDLVSNIVGHPMLKPAEKAKALQAVASGFEARLTQAVGKEVVEKDLDALAVEAILAHDKRHIPILENITDMVKRKLSAGARKNLGDGDFALVTEKDGKKERKYPIHDKAHVRNALARAAQQIKEGGEGAADAKAAMPKIRAAAKKFGIETSMEKDRNAIVIEKDAKGDWRWVGWVSNKFIDWDGDIIAEDAHKEYLEWLDKNADVAPIFLTWHTPGTAREAPVDFWSYENGFLVMSGKLTENEATMLLKAQTIADLGMSHGTMVLARDEKDPRVVTKYRMYEVSDLPLENAANPWTSIEAISKEVGMDKKAYFAQLLGSDEKADEFLKKTGLKKEALETAGVESKEKSDETATATVVEPEAHVKEPAETVKVDTKALVEQVIKEAGLEELSTWFVTANEALEKVPALEELVKAMQVSQEDKLAEMITPPAERFAWLKGKGASNSKDNVLKEKDEDLKKAVPGVPDGYWLSEATNTAPVRAE